MDAHVGNQDQGVHQEAEDPAAEEIFADPDEQNRPVARVDDFIQTSNWAELEELVINIIPTSHGAPHPSRLHPFIFLTIWRRQVMDLIDGGDHNEAARIYAEKIYPLRETVTAYAYSEKLRQEIAQIGDAIRTGTSQAHAHCATDLMKKLVNDYLRLYLPNSIGYVPPKALSLWWEFAIRLDIPGSSIQEFTNCNVGTRMRSHLRVCPGITPEAKRRYTETLLKESKKRSSGPDDDRNNLLSNKALKMTEVSEPLHLMNQQIQEGSGILDGISKVTQDADVTLGIDMMKRCMGNMRDLLAMALQLLAPPAAVQLSQAPQAPLPPVQAAVHAQVQLQALQPAVHAQVQPQAPPAPQPAVHAQVQPQAPPAPQPAVHAMQPAVHAQVQPQAPPAPQPAVHAQVQLQAPPAPQPVLGPFQAAVPAQVAHQAPPAPQPVFAPGPAQAAIHAQVAAPAIQPAPAANDVPDYHPAWDGFDL